MNKKRGLVLFAFVLIGMMLVMPFASAFSLIDWFKNLFGFGKDVRLSPGNLKGINIDFGPPYNAVQSGLRGTAAVNNSDLWSFVQRNNNNDHTESLKFSDGSVSSVKVRLQDLGGAYSWSDNAGVNNPMYKDYIYRNDRYRTSRNAVVTLSNVPAGEYKLLIYGHGDQNAQGGDYTVSVGSTLYGNKKTSTSPTPPSSNWKSSTVWTEGVQYVSYPSIVVGAGQSISIVIKPVSYAALINGLQLVPVTSSPLSGSSGGSGSGSGTVSKVTYDVYVKNYSGAFIPNASVVVWNDSAGTVYSGQTNASRALRTTVFTGPYYVNASASGYLRNDSTRVFITEGGRIDIYLGTLSVAPVACDYRYSPWGVCNSTGSRIRIITSSAPARCRGTPGPLMEECTPPVCTDSDVNFAYTDGKNYYLAGTANNVNDMCVRYRPDGATIGGSDCIPLNGDTCKVSEAYCRGGVADLEYVPCSNGCSAGVCAYGIGQEINLSSNYLIRAKVNVNNALYEALLLSANATATNLSVINSNGASQSAWINTFSSVNLNGINVQVLSASDDSGIYRSSIRVNA